MLRYGSAQGRWVMAAMVMASSAAGAGEIRQQSAKAMPAPAVLAVITFMDASLKKCVPVSVSATGRQKKIERGGLRSLNVLVERAIGPKI